MSRHAAGPSESPLQNVVGRRTSRELAARLANDIPDGWFVNIGIGKPTIIADVVEPEREIVFHSENGIVGVGHFAEGSAQDDDLINASKEPILIVSGAAFVNHSDSFALIRGGHLDLAVMGAFQVAENGDFANWSIPGEKIPAIGGAMDLAVGAKRTWIMMDLLDRAGVSKLCERCTYPLTARGAVERVYTELAIFEISTIGFVVRELVEGLNLEELQRYVPVEIRLEDSHLI